MQKLVKVFRSHAQAEKADREFYKSLTPRERLDILLALIARDQKAGQNETRTGLKRVYRVVNAPRGSLLVVGAPAPGA